MLHQIDHTHSLRRLNERLRQALDARDTAGARHCITTAETINLEQVEEDALDEYEILLAVANDLLNSHA